MAFIRMGSGRVQLELASGVACGLRPGRLSSHGTGFRAPGQPTIAGRGLSLGPQPFELVLWCSMMRESSRGEEWGKPARVAGCGQRWEIRVLAIGGEDRRLRPTVRAPSVSHWRIGSLVAADLRSYTIWREGEIAGCIRSENLQGLTWGEGCWLWRW